MITSIILLSTWKGAFSFTPTITNTRIPPKLSSHNKNWYHHYRHSFSSFTILHQETKSNSNKTSNKSPPQPSPSSSSSSPKTKNTNKKKEYQQIGEPLDTTICPISKQEILQLLQERTYARRKQNFKKADDILLQLKKCNVYVNDATNQWRGDGKSFVSFNKGSTTSSSSNNNNNNTNEEEDSLYIKSKNSKPITDHDEEYIIRKLQQRYMAKINRDYDLADDILDELKFYKNVEIDDANRTFRVVDPFKLEYTFGGKRVNNIHPDVLVEIESKIKQRADAKKKKDYKLADLLLEELTDVHHVRVDDVKKEWHFMRKKGGNLDVPVQVQIQENEMNGGQRRNKQNEKGSKKGRDAFDSIADFSVIDDSNDAPPKRERFVSDMSIPEGIVISDDDSIDNNIIEVPEGIMINGDNSSSDMVPIPEGVVIEDENDPSNRSTLESMTVPNLKEKLKEAGLPVSGRKKDLIERLMNSQ